MKRLRSLVTLFHRTGQRFSDIEGFRLGAAFSFYAIFAIFPLMLLSVTVIGFVIGDDAPARDRILDAVASGDSPIRHVLEQATDAMQQSRSSRGFSAVIGLATLLFSASGAFVELDSALNTIWKVPRRNSKGIGGTIRDSVLERLSGFAIVAAFGLVLLGSLVSTAVLGFFVEHVPGKLASLGPTTMRLGELGASLVLMTAAITAAFHFVPRSHPSIRTVFPGAAITTVALTLLKTLFAIYLTRITSYSAYGIAGGVLALAMWIYLSAQTAFMGATLTRVHCEMTGSVPATPEPAGGHEGLAAT